MLLDDDSYYTQHLKSSTSTSTSNNDKNERNLLWTVEIIERKENEHKDYVYFVKFIGIQYINIYILYYNIYVCIYILYLGWSDSYNIWVTSDSLFLSGLYILI